MWGCRIKICLSFVSATLLLWLCNVLWDSNYTFGFGDDSIILAALSKKVVTSVERTDEILPINISYDRELIPTFDEYGIPIGNIDIADREKIVTLLSHLNSYGNYQYVVCDLDFDEVYKTPFDSVLYALIASMPRIVIPEVPGLPEEIKPVAAPSTYAIFHHGEPFLKYRFLNKDGRSLPLKMWHDLSGNDIYNHWWGYSSSERCICNNASILDLNNVFCYPNLSKKDAENDIEIEEKWIYNLGADILSAGCPRALFEDKIILIGDYYERDIHDTATGPVPGIMILYSAYETLNNKKYLIPPYCYVILFCIFFIYSFILFFPGGWRINDRFLAFFADSISFTFPLKVFNFLTLFFGGFSVNAVMIGSLFGLASYLKKKFFDE